MSNDKSEPVKLLRYYKIKAEKYVGNNKPYPSLSQFMNRAVSDLIDKLEKKESRK